MRLLPKGKFRRGLALTTVFAVTFLGLQACTEQDASDTDLDEPKQEGDALPDDYSSRAPDSITVYQNVDNHPTIVKVCIEGLAFRTVSTTYVELATPAVERVEEWDASCEK